MNLFNKYQSRAFQFALALLAKLEGQSSLSGQELDGLARRMGLDYADQVAAPLMRAGILEKRDGRWRRSPECRPFALPPQPVGAGLSAVHPYSAPGRAVSRAGAPAKIIPNRRGQICSG